MEYTSQMIFGGAVLALLCVFASILSRRLGAPLLLVFLVLGMLAGEDGPGKILFNDFNLAFLFGNLALAIIIFDGGLGTRKSTFRVALSPALSLATVGVVATAVITGVAAHWILGLSWQEGLLLGAIVGSTDAAAVFGLLRMAGLELKERTSATLEIESGTNDPMAIFLTLTLVQILVAGNGNAGWSMLITFFQQMGFGIAIGFGGGYLLTSVLRKLNLSSSLYPLLALAGGMTIFGLTNIVGGSGFLAIFIVGFLIGNAPLPYASDIHRFHDVIAWLSQIGMFLMLGLLIKPSSLPPLMVPAIGIALVLIFIARPIAVALALFPFHFPWREQMFIGWCGLRGAVPIILALFPSLAGLEGTSGYFELVFFVVLISLILQGWTIAPLSKWLRIELPPAIKEPKHLSLKIPNEQEKELLVYHAVAGSSSVGMAPSRLPLQEGAQLVGLVRHGMLVNASEDKALQADDHVIVLANAGTVAAMGRVFAPAAGHRHLEPAAFFGEFVLKPDIPLVDIAQLYRFQLPEAAAGLTVAQYIEKQFHGKPVVGDRVALNSVQLVVREIAADRISAVGLKLARI